MKSQFSVPKPCHENWNAMTPDEQGRFCSLCSKSVTDFTQMSDDEITIYLKMNNGSSVCGRFRSSQLQKGSISIPKKVLYSQTKFVNVFLLALLITMGSMLFSCKEENHLIGEIAEPPQDTIALPPPPSPENEELHTLRMVSYTQDTITPPFIPKAEQHKTPINPAIKSTNN